MINFVDQFTTVSLCADEVGNEVVRIVEEVNKHHHTKTCKPKPKCRFRYPKFPVWKTILVKPYKCEFSEEKEHYLKKYSDILSKVQEQLEDQELMDTIMSKYKKKEDQLLIIRRAQAKIELPRNQNPEKGKVKAVEEEVISSKKTGVI